MNETSIDVIVCTYNNAALLDRTLAAIAEQDVSPEVDWAVTVVNNNCTDATPEIVEKHARSFMPSLRMIFEPQQGLTHARVCGVKHSSREWVAFVDDDCLLAEDWIELAARFAVEHPACGAFGGRVTPIWETTPPPFVLHNRYAYAGKNHGDSAHRRPWIAGAGMVVRRAALDACGWSDKQFLEDRVGGRLVSGGDMEIALRVGSKYELWYTPDCKIRHIIPERRMSQEYFARITYGLGASRHNAGALTWRGSYPGWFAYSSLYGVGLSTQGVLRFLSEGFGSKSGMSLSMMLSPARGWCAAMRGMLQMNPEERRQLIGCAKRGG